MDFDVEQYLQNLGSFYVGRVNTTLELLRMTSDPLLSIPAFSMPLFELLVIGAVSGAEAYLHDRLLSLVYSSETARDRFLGKYNGRRRSKITEDQIESALSEGGVIFHRISDINDYFKTMVNVEIIDLPTITEFTEIVNERHEIVHNMSRKLNPYTISSVRSKCESVMRFIMSVERRFVDLGYMPVNEDVIE